MVHIVIVIPCMRCKSIANRADSSHVEVSFIYGRWFTSNAWPKPHLKDNDMQSFQSWGFYAQQIWLIRHIIRAQNAQLHLYELERPVSMSEPCSSALPPTQHPKRSVQIHTLADHQDADYTYVNTNELWLYCTTWWPSPSSFSASGSASLHKIWAGKGNFNPTLDISRK